MAVQVKSIKREFRMAGVKLADPNPSETPAEVLAHYAGTLYPELTNAKIKGPTMENGVEIYSFDKEFAPKG